MPSGKGAHWLPIRAALCALIGKDQAGIDVTIHLDRRVSRVVVTGARRSTSRRDAWARGLRTSRSCGLVAWNLDAPGSNNRDI